LIDLNRFLVVLALAALAIALLWRSTRVS